MKKRLMVALAAIAVTVSVAGCGGDGKLSNDYVTVNQYKGLEIAKVEKKEVSDDDVEQTIQSRLLSSGKTDGLTKDGAAEDGDWVILIIQVLLTAQLLMAEHPRDMTSSLVRVHFLLRQMTTKDLRNRS